MGWDDGQRVRTTPRAPMKESPWKARAEERAHQRSRLFRGIPRLLIDVCVKLNMALLVAAFATMMVSGLAQVLFRYVVNRPLSWTEELARFSFVWIVFLGAALGVRYASHLGVDVLLNSLNERIRTAVVTFTQGLVLLMLLALIRESLQVSLFNMAQISPALELPMGIPYLALPVGFFLMFVYTAASVVAGAAELLGMAPGPQVPDNTDEGNE